MKKFTLAFLVLCAAQLNSMELIKGYLGVAKEYLKNVYQAELQKGAIEAFFEYDVQKGQQCIESLIWRGLDVPRFFRDHEVEGIFRRGDVFKILLAYVDLQALREKINDEIIEVQKKLALVEKGFYPSFHAIYYLQWVPTSAYTDLWEKSHSQEKRGRWKKEFGYKLSKLTKALTILNNYEFGPEVQLQTVVTDQ